MSWHDYPRYRLPEQQEFYDTFMGFLWCLALVLGLAPMVRDLIRWAWWQIWPYWHWV